MDTFTSLMSGFGVMMDPTYLLLAFIGAAAGTAIGVLPGLSPSVSIALLLPVAFQIGDPTGAMILFAGIFYGAMYGGSTTSILLNTPGEAANVVTALDGYAMARKGRGGAALATAAIGSFIAGTLATMGLVLIARPLLSVALSFGPAEYLALMVLALSVVGALGGRPIYAAFSTLAGLAVGTVGIEAVSGQSRFTFGVPQLYDGIDFILAAIALFAISEAIIALSNVRQPGQRLTANIGGIYMSRQEWRRSGMPWMRGSVLGFLVGILPGAGATIASFMSYGVERRVSKQPEQFGHGAIEGVAGPEAANNSAAAGAMVPLLLLGIPGSATTAVMLGGLRGFGIETGPLLMRDEPRLVWTLIASFYIANVILLAMNLPLVRMWVKLLKVPVHILFPIVLVVCVLGVYTINGSMVDLYLMFAIGILGVFARRAGIPLAPFILGLILGPLMEAELGRTLTGSGGDWSALIKGPIPATIYAALILGIAASSIIPRLRSSARKGVQNKSASV